MQTAKEYVQWAQANLEMAAALLAQPAGPVDPPAEDAPVAASYLIVGKARGLPGETVTVEILGQTHAPVRGFTMAIGLDPKQATLESWIEAPGLEELVGPASTADIMQSKRGGIADFISVFCGFFNIPDHPAVDVLIPPLMPMLTLQLKIADDVPLGSRIPLTNRRGYYGKDMSNGVAGVPSVPIKMDCMYATDPHGPNPHGIFPGWRGQGELVSGWIDVKEPE